MSKHATEVEAVFGLYQAAVTPHRWHDALSAVMPLVGADSFHFLGWNKTKFETDFNLFSNPEFVSQGEKYSAYYGGIDPRRQFAETIPVGELFLCQNLFSEDYVARSEFYQDFLLPSGHRYMMGTKTLSNSNHETALAVLRSADRPSAFSEADIATGHRLLAHVSRACHLWAHTESLRLGAHLSSASAFALIGLDSFRRIVHLNPAAEALLKRGDCLAQQNGFLTALLPDNASSLRAAIKRVMDTGCAVNLAISGLRSGQDSCMLRIARLERPSGFGLLLSSADVMITAQMRDAPVNLTPRILQETFGLTKSEAAVAIAMAEGRTPEEHATRTGLGMPTVRTQLRSVFEKTQTHRQAELVRLLLQMPST